MIRIALGLTAALLIALSWQISPADAGGGIRLQFGGPLGGFIANPGRGSYRERSEPRRERYSSPRKSPKSTSRSTHNKSTSKKKTQYAEKRSATRERLSRIRKQQTESRTQVANKSERRSTPRNRSETPDKETPDKTLAAKSDGQDKTDVGAVDETKEQPQGVTITSGADPSTPSVSLVAPDCKRFDPAAGVMVSVACD